jgi:hypothetical protein
MHRTLVLSLTLLVAGITAASAQFPAQPPPPQCPGPVQGNEQDRAACHGDVTTYCTAELQANQCDVFAILGCLQRNRPRISTACRHVLEANGK